MSKSVSPERDELLTTVHVWQVCPDDVAGEVLDRGLAWLTAEQIARRDKLATDHLRHSFLAARVLCRVVLSRYTGVETSVWSFAAGDHGKPGIAGPAGFESLRFNLTHTEGLVACAVSRAGDVGVDAEEISRAVDFAQVARHFLSAAEQEQLAALPADQRAARFFALWVLKEAYLKGRGTGLWQSLNRFAIEWGADGNPLPLEDWQLTLHQPSARHVAGVAVRAQLGAGPIAIRWFQAAELLDACVG